MSFALALNDFLDAVKTRDHARFLTYFEEGQPFSAVLPGGKEYADVASFLASQDTWFKGNTGRFDFAVKRVEQASDIGVGVVRVNYQNVDGAGVHFALEIAITFVFRKTERWVLVHDQNTVLAERR